ncbi:hypothetical protein HK104_000911 [Borealophlyctis nickersoniae]|nr:hypothetical protein HK104_000911 [Borealophlyctis nickersoniae]
MPKQQQFFSKPFRNGPSAAVASAATPRHSLASQHEPLEMSAGRRQRPPHVFQGGRTARGTVDRAFLRMQANDEDDYEEEEEEQLEDEGEGEFEFESGEEESDDGEEECGYDDEDEDQDEEEDEEEEANAEEDLAQLKAELANVPFDQLLEIQQKVGLKQFHANYRGRKVKQGADTGSESDGSEEAIEQDRKGRKNAGSLPKGGKEEKASTKRVKPPKRKDKNMPVEVTSKKTVGRFRAVVELPQKKVRDPRFDPLAGKLNEDIFKRSYGFLRDYEASEIELLKKQIEKERDEGEKERLRRALTSMTSRKYTRERKEQRASIVRDWKKKQAERVKEGKAPRYLKNSDIKKLELVERYQALGEKGVEKVLEKKRKKNAAKEHRHVPYKRRSA